MLESDFNTDWYVVRERPKPDSERYLGPVILPRDEMILSQRSPNVAASHNNGYYPGGIYRYTKTFAAPIEWRSRHVVVRFESIYHRSKVYLNGALVGGRASGYCTVHIDLAPHLVYGKDNVIEVVADTLAQPNSRWYTGSGIYRPVHLLLSESNVAIQPFGVKLYTKSLETRGLTPSATVGLNLAVTSTSSSPTQVKVEVELRELKVDGKSEVTASRSRFSSFISPGSSQIENDIVVDDVQAWSVDSPSLYHVQVRLFHKDTGELLDTTLTQFGIRTLDLTPERGLCINGKRVLIRGACIHHDNGVIGAVTLPAAEDRRVRIMKEAGFNAIRSAHNSISIATLNACDKYGMIVMDEHTDNWYQVKVMYDCSLDFDKWWRKDLEAIVEKDYNHPSVIMYSIGNEIPDSATAWGVALAAEMTELCKKLDPHRYTTIAVNGFINMLYPANRAKPVRDSSILDKVKETDSVPGGVAIKMLNLFMGSFLKLMSYAATTDVVDRKTKDVFSTVDIAGYNYLVERYPLDLEKHPRRMIVGSETGSIAGVATWPMVEKHPQLLGDFVWTGWDYIGEASIAGPHYKRLPTMGNPFPAHLGGEPFVDITGYIQPQCYHSSTAWHLRQGRPYLAVRPLPVPARPLIQNIWRLTDAVHSWNWEGCEGKQTEAVVYSDSHKVKLLLDGHVVGEQPAGEAFQHVCRFNIRYQPGTLEAVAYDTDGKEVGRDVLRSAETDKVHLQLKPETSSFEIGGQDLIYIPITLVDEKAVCRPIQKATITLNVSGPATLLGFGNANPSNPRGFHSNEHETYQGRALAVIRSTAEEGLITILAKSSGLPDATVNVRALSR